MPLTLQTRRVGDITILTCKGRIIDGDESATLKKELSELPDPPLVILDLSGVEFIDSAGLGLIVRILARVQAAHGHLALCAVPARIQEVLKITHLQTILESYDTETTAMTAFYQPAKATASVYRLRTDILCVETSDEVLAFVRQLLGQAGYGVQTASNLPDALMLLKAARPKLLVVGSSVRAAHGTQAAETFQRLASSLAVVELPDDFSSRDAGSAANSVLAQVRTLIGAGDSSAAKSS